MATTPESFGPYLGSTGMGLSGGSTVGQSLHMKLPPQSLHLPQQQTATLAGKQGTQYKAVCPHNSAPGLESRILGDLLGRFDWFLHTEGH